MSASTPSRRTIVSLAAIAPLTAAMAACSSDSKSSSSKSSGGASSGAAQASGSINVLFAGSLVKLMNSDIFPAFTKASGVSPKGFAGGSNGLASQIQSKAKRADVFVSASPKADEQIMGTKNGDWVKWYVQFATAKLVLGYSEKSKFAKDVKTMPWQKLLSQPGIKVGTTDPKTDPKGKLAHQALTDEGKKYPALAKLANDAEIVHSEESMVGQLQAGQMDVAFFYLPEAKAADIPTVELTGTDLKAKYTVTIPKGAQNEDGAVAFIKYLLGENGSTTMKKYGYDIAKSLKVTGSDVPAALTEFFKTK